RLVQERGNQPCRSAPAQGLRSAAHRPGYFQTLARQLTSSAGRGQDAAAGLKGHTRLLTLTKSPLPTISLDQGTCRCPLPATPPAPRAGSPSACCARPTCCSS